jgi:hypothetical protein
MDTPIPDPALEESRRARSRHGPLSSPLPMYDSGLAPGGRESWQDAEKRILTGKSRMENGKAWQFATSICHFRSGRDFSAAC